MDIDARDFGRLEGEVAALHQMMTAQNVTLAQLSVQVDVVSRTLSEARGGWKTLLWIGGAAAAASSAVTWALQHLLIFTK